MLLPELRQKILDGQAILILGQEHLKWSKTNLNSFIPDLLKLIGKDLAKDQIAQGFYNVCSLLLSNGVPPELISDSLYKLTNRIDLSENLVLTLSAPWRAIYTTAIDDLVGRTLQGIEHRSIRNAFGKEGNLINPRDPSNLYIMRLMGSIDQIDYDRMPAFSISSRKSAIRGLLDRIEEFVGVDDAIFVIAGFNTIYEDSWICRQLWERLEETINASHSYWFETSVDKTTDGSLNELIDTGRLRVIEDIDLPNFLGTFQSDFELASTPERYTVRTKHSKIEFSASQMRLYQQSMIVLTEAIANTKSLTFSTPDERYERFRAFLRAERKPDWAAHASGFVYERPAVMASLEKLKKVLKHGRSKHNSVVTVSGPSGSGKTVALEHLAFQLCRDGYPVIYVPKRSRPPDFRVIDSFCQAVQPLELKKGAEGLIRIVILWDDLSVDANRYKSLASYLLAQGRSALVIGSTFAPSRMSANGFRYADLDEEIHGTELKLSNISLPTALQAEEANNFVAYLREIDDELLQFLNETEFTKSLSEDFLIALYDHMPALRANLASGLRIQYKTYQEILKPRIEGLYGSYKNQWKHLLPLVFVPSQFGCFPNLELVLDALGEGYRDLWLHEDKSKLLMDGLLYEDRESGILRLRARNARVAQISLKGKVTQQEQLNYLRRLVKAVRPKFSIELNFLVSLFSAIRNATRDETLSTDNPTGFRSYQKELASILKEFREVYREPFLMHTEAIFLRRSTALTAQTQEYEYEEQVSVLIEAIEILDEALQLLEEERGAERAPAEKQNISNSVATTYRDLIKLRLTYINNNPDLDHSTLLRIIEEEQLLLTSFCDRAAFGAFPNTYEVDVYVTSLLNRYSWDIFATQEQKAFWAVEMIEELDRAEQSFSDQDLTTILNTRVQVEEALSKFIEQKETIEKLLCHGSLSGYFLKARSQAYPYNLRSKKYTPDVQGLSAGLETLRALDWTILTQDSLCLSLHNRIWWDLNAPNSRIGNKPDLTVKLSQNKWEEYRDLLQLQLNLEQRREGRTAFVRFMLGWANLQAGDSAEAGRLFRELDHQTIGHPYRVRPLVRFSDTDGHSHQLSGDVVEISDPRTGRVYCPKLRTTIPFRLYAFGQTVDKGDPLEFEVMMNYRGLLAVPLRSTQTKQH